MPVVLSGIRGIVFDLDDTLYAEHDYVLSGFAAVSEWLRTQISCPEDPCARLKALFDSGKRGKLFDLLLEDWNVDGRNELIAQMVTQYRQHAPSLSLYPDADRAIARWKGHFRMGLISDGPALAQRRKIASLQLERHLEPIICTDEWGREFWKPHPRAFTLIQETWRLASENCVYIADNPAKDFIAPNALGWHSIQIIRPGSEYGRQPIAPGGAAAFLATDLDEVELTLRA